MFRVLGDDHINSGTLENDLECRFAAIPRQVLGHDHINSRRGTLENPHCTMTLSAENG